MNVYFSFICFQRMKEDEEANLAPMQQRMNRNQSFEEEHKHAIEKTVNLNEPHVEALTQENSTSAMVNNAVSSHCNSNSTQEETDWEKLYEKLFECDDHELEIENNIVAKENENNIV